MNVALPLKLRNVVDMFVKSPKAFRLQALVEFSKKIPPLPERYAKNRDQMEQVHECQSPFFLASEINDGRVYLFFDAPPEAPTVRGFAGILLEGLEGATLREVLDVPEDFYIHMGLSELITPMRLRGMSAILYRIKAQIRAAGHI